MALLQGGVAPLGALSAPAPAPRRAAGPRAWPSLRQLARRPAGGPPSSARRLVRAAVEEGGGGSAKGPARPRSSNGGLAPRRPPVPREEAGGTPPAQPSGNADATGDSAGQAHSASPPQATASDLEQERDPGSTQSQSELGVPGPGSKLAARGADEPKVLRLGDVNPFGLGRRSRQLFDDVWRRLVQLGQLGPAPRMAEQFQLPEGPNCDFTTPEAQFTTVLVVGATGRVGRVLVRKLLLRGYSVTALVRKTDAAALELLPRAVKTVCGDLGDAAALKEAIQGCSKVIFCAAARSTVSGDLLQVDHRGVDHVARSFLDYNHSLAQRRRGRSAKSKITVAKFSRVADQTGWELREGSTQQDNSPDSIYDGGMDAELEYSEKGNGIFTGYVYTKGGYVELVRRFNLPDGVFLDRYEGLLVNVVGDGKSYMLVLSTDPSTYGGAPASYGARFNTRLGYTRVRVPFAAFRPLGKEDNPMDVSLVREIGIRFEPRKLRPGGPMRPSLAASNGSRNGTPNGSPNGSSTRSSNGAAKQIRQDETSFRLEVDFIKALPGGEETDYILVSCTGAGLEATDRDKVLRAKLAGEAALRNSGLGYTIIRPGPLQEEPGGQKALVFDQGNRITQGISCADVADVCVKALHDATARNKTFDVCYEYTDGQGLYELVAHLPDKSNNYLTPALALLEKNT